MAYRFATAYLVDDGFAVESAAGGSVGQTFDRNAESWEIVRVYSLGYVISNPDTGLWPTVDADYELT